jgi:deazaflavin-dependent oxidoreductase (nitroreductase family)
MRTSQTACDQEVCAVRAWWLLASIGLLAAAGVLFVRFVLVRESARRRLFPVLRPLYQHTLNPNALRAAARGETRWGVIHHVGRRSGAAYVTPVDAQRTREGVVICLVYGAGADWCRNILAAGGCTLTLDGADLVLTAPRVIAMSAAAEQLSAERARVWRSIGIEHCLALQLAPERAGVPPKETST